MSQVVDKHQIARNAMFLYIRTFAIIIVMLVCSRVLLRGLGVEEFGLYGLVGSIVAMFTSLRVIFASATQRFLNYEKAKQDLQILSNIFAISKRLHAWLAVLFVIICETIGLWAICSYLNIPDGKFTDAIIVLQCSIFSAVTMIMTVPYDAVIISNERFNAYAYFAILEYLLQLGAAFAITLVVENRLIVYSIAVLAIALVVRLVNMIYCRMNFAECRHKGYFDKALMKDMAKFAGWSFLGNFALTIYLEGINMVLNVFGGVVANAAQSLSTLISKGLSSVSERMATAFAPQATEQYSIGEHDKFNELVILSAKIISYVYLLMAIPMTIFTEWMIEFWLGEVPQYSVEFVRAILIYGLARTIHSPLNLGFVCSGRLKSYQIMETALLLPSLPLAYIFLKFGLPLYWALLSMAICNTINDIAIAILARRVWHFRAKEFVTKALVPIFCIIFASSLVSSLIMLYVDNIYLQMALVVTATALSIFTIGLTATERRRAVALLKRKVE